MASRNLKLPRVYYTLCGTDGKTESALLLGVRGRRIILADERGNQSGWMPARGCFFTAAQARSDWRRRAGAESSEHVEAIKRAGERLLAVAERYEKRRRVPDDWRNL
jgi:hypothetical protein